MEAFCSAGRGWLLAVVVWSVTSLLASSRGAEISPKGPVPRDSLITVTHQGSAFVIGMVGGKFVQVPTHECPGALVFTGPPGSYLVMVVEGQTRFQAIVEITGTPEPPPPTPPPPTPPPDPSVPASVLRAYGIGPAVYLETLKTGASASDLQRMANGYMQAAVYLHELRLTPAGAQAQMRELREKTSGSWSAWEQVTEKCLNAAIAKHGSGQLQWRDYCREIASALTEAATRMTRSK